MGFVENYRPNRLAIQDSQNDTNWHILATDGTAYTTLALLLAAGKSPFPSLDPGVYCHPVLKSLASGGTTDGSPFHFAWNKLTAPTDATSMEVSGNGQTWELPGMILNLLWLEKSVGSDLINVMVTY